jgi:feruloyl esterase
LQAHTIGGASITTQLVADSASYPEYCKVSGTIPPRLKFELRLPTQWNRRVLFIGGGGLNGVIFPPETLMFNPSIADAGYATVGTDSGHQGTPVDASWALNDPEAVANFAYLSTHTVLGAARAIVTARYGRDADRAYFFGESTGGREGLIEAQRWPEDFDGIVALEPVYNMTALMLAENRVAQQVFRTPGGRLSPAHLDALGHASLAACDTLDGIADGIISNVAACRFDPAALRCAGPADETCLSDAQIETVNLVHSTFNLGVALANGVDSYPGWPVGHEDNSGGWQTWITGSRAEPTTSLGAAISGEALRFMVAGEPSLDPLQFSPAAYAEELRAFSELIDATDPDLSAYAARGGKLILWHGWGDYAVSARSTARYYEQVNDAMGADDTEDFLRFYTSPGVDHLAGGPGASTIDFLAALTAWVESGIAPGDLVATKHVQGTIDPLFARPLCRYPTYPRYDGSGDAAAAASFRCAH